MSFADPQSVTIASVAQSMPRVSSGPNAGLFQTNDGLVSLSVSHTYGRRNRHTIRLNHAKVAADPFAPSVNQKFSMSMICSIDVPPTGYTVAQAKDVVDALVAYLAASTGAKVTQLLGGEN